jgi:hypothetical protein
MHRFRLLGAMWISRHLAPNSVGGLRPGASERDHPGALKPRYREY